MPNITIRDVPEPVHAVLARRAERQGQSLQRYLVDLLTHLTAAPTMSEWIDEVDAVHASFDPTRDRTFDDAAYLRAAREERGDRLAGL